VLVVDAGREDVKGFGRVEDWDGEGNGDGADGEDDGNEKGRLEIDFGDG
jgi:hypothetical protein